jgi:hypothetical protein
MFSSKFFYIQLIFNYLLFFNIISQSFLYNKFILFPNKFNFIIFNTKIYFIYFLKDKSNYYKLTETKEYIFVFLYILFENKLLFFFKSFKSLLKTKEKKIIFKLKLNKNLIIKKLLKINYSFNIFYVWR